MCFGVLELLEGERPIDLVRNAVLVHAGLCPSTMASSGSKVDGCICGRLRFPSETVRWERDTKDDVASTGRGD